MAGAEDIGIERTISIESTEGENRYELSVGGERAGMLVYRDEGDTRVFLHTEIDPAYRGRGLATTLIEWALDDVRTSGRHLRAECPTVIGYLARHPELDYS